MEAKALRDDIETKERKLKGGDSVEKVQKELRRIKIVDKRDYLWNIKTHETHYMEKERETIK